MTGALASAPARLEAWPGLADAWREARPASAIVASGRVLVFWVPELPPGLNGPAGQTRMHHHRITRRKKGWRDLVYLALCTRLNGAAFPWRRVRVEFTRFSSQAMDWDNHGASFKFIGDALIDCGVIPDDNPRHVAGLDLRQEKVSPKAPKGVLVVVKREDEA